jgi:hypothetical protein
MFRCWQKLVNGNVRHPRAGAGRRRSIRLEAEARETDAVRVRDAMPLKK